MTFRLSYYYFHLTAIFPGELRSAGFSSSAPPPVLEEKPLGSVEREFLWVGCPSCHPTISVVEALKGTQSTNPNHIGLTSCFLYSQWTLMEGALLPFSMAMVAWLSGRTSVFGRRTFSVLCSSCSWRVTTYVGKPSAVGQPTRPTQPFIPSGSIDE